MFEVSEAFIHYPYAFLYCISPQAEVGGLGFGVAGGVDNPSDGGSSGIFITKFLPNTPAERSGRLQ